MRFWERPDFIALEREWYAKLADAGFDDIEAGNEDQRIRHDLPMHMQPVIAQERRQYCEFLSERLTTAIFPNPTDRLIMQMRAEGARIKEICTRIEDQGFGATYIRRAVRFRIRIYEMKWGLRSYTPKQLGRKAG